MGYLGLLLHLILGCLRVVEFLKIHFGQEIQLNLSKIYNPMRKEWDRKNQNKFELKSSRLET